MNELTTTRDLPMLAGEITRTNQLVEDSKNKAIHHAIECGAALIEAKALCVHGEWLGWLKSNCDVSERTVQVYMKLANEYPLLEESNPQRVADLSIREAVKLLSTPKEVEPIAADIGWMPKGEQLAHVTLGGFESLYLQESIYQGFYWVAYICEPYIDYFIKPVRNDYVEKAIFDWLPGKHTRNCKIENLKWEYLDSKPDFVKKITQGIWTGEEATLSSLRSEVKK